LNNCPESGDVVSIAENKTIQKSSIPYDSKLSGIISTSPGFVMWGSLDATSSRLVALAGRVSVKVSLENGPIAVGDLLTSASSTPGVAMKATEPGRVIGMALESLSDKDFENCDIENSLKIENCELKIGRIMVFINPHWSIGQLSEDGSLATADTATNTSDTGIGSLLADFVQKVKETLASLGLFIENGIARIKTLIVENLQIGTPEKPTGITIYDRATGEPYCVYVENGQTKTSPGACESLTSTSSEPEEPSPSASSGQTAEETPTCTPDWQCADWQPAPETQACGQTFSQTRTCNDLNNCGTEEEEGKPSESQDATGNLCSADNTTGTCQSGICSFTCQDGFSDCDNDMSNGCEVASTTCPAP
jgi:hypothetical protein